MVRLNDALTIQPQEPLDWLNGMVIDDEALLSLWQQYRAALDVAQSFLGHVEHEIQVRMETRDARELPHPTLEVKLQYATPTVEYSALHRLIDILPPDIIAQGFTPAHEEMQQVPGKWNMIRVNAWARTYGKEVAEIIEQAKTQGRARLVIRPKPGIKSRTPEVHHGQS